MRVKNRIYTIIERISDTDIVSKTFQLLIMALIILNTLSIILESYETIYANYMMYFIWFERISIVAFTAEYILRIWVADIKGTSFKERLLLRFKYAVSFMAVIDLVAILPFYLPMIISFDLRFLRMLRITRLLRMFKMNRYSRAMSLIGKVIRESKEQLISTVFILVFIVMVSSTLIYYIENPAQPDKFPNIVASFWWAIATLTTVGYGDIYPVTGLGKALSSVIAVLGIGLVALPTGIISSGFMNEIKKEDSMTCPHCGKCVNED